MKRLLMAEQWDSFARAVFKPDTPPIQRIEMRRAFYAGAQAILFGVINAFAPDAEPTAEDLMVMDDLQRELNDFVEAVKQGRA